jgi:beta-mannosidase
MEVDLLSGATWECRSTPEGLASEPKDVAALDPAGWRRALVPGTAAASERAAGIDPYLADYDKCDWWFSCRFAAPRATSTGTPYVLQLGGLATIADVWMNGGHILHAENMFRSYELEIDRLEEENELMIRFASLDAALRKKRPRPRWKSYLVSHQNLRFVRTTLMGRMPGWAETPAPVGPYKPVGLFRTDSARIVGRRMDTSCDGDQGSVRVDLRLRGAQRLSGASLVIGDHRAVMEVSEVDGDVVVRGALRLGAVRRWWPHTHGDQPLYEVDLEIDGRRLRVGRVGFRTVELDRSDDGFTLSVNGVPVFCRGAVWMPTDPVSMSSDQLEVRRMLELAKAGNLNLIRVPGTGVYQDEVFWDTCDELGLLVWHECMLAFYDPPDEPGFVSELTAELGQQFDLVSGRPSLALVCGSQETEEQAAMNSLPRAKWGFPVLDCVIPDLVAGALPGVPYVTSNPTGGAVPYQMDSGVCQYFGIGGYLRPLDDARRARVRFAAECLAFATPPERRTIDEACGGAYKAGHDPRWKQAVHHDAGRSWDLEDMQGYYTRKLFGVDPFEVRYGDPERALDLARATVVTVFETVMSEWRRTGSTCSGATVLALRDLRAGGGWGVVDILGRAKAPWFALRRMLSPVGMLVTDEGLNGLHLHLVNDRPDPVRGVVRVELFVRGELLVESVVERVEVDGRSGESIQVAQLFDGFRDLTDAYSFGPPAHDVVSLSFVGDEGETFARAIHLPAGIARALEPDVGLEAGAKVVGGAWTLSVTTRRFAQWVVVDVPGFRPDDSWFHLAPGETRSIVLHPEGQPGAPPAGEVRALNSLTSARFSSEPVS